MAASRPIKFELIGYSPACLLMLISKLGERELLTLLLEKAAKCLLFDAIEKLLIVEYF